MHDMVIRSGKVVDGTGVEGRTADIAIDNGRISVIGGEVGPGRHEIDAAGHLSLIHI